MDHKATVEKKKNLLMAAGINEADAVHVAHDLALQRVPTEKGGVDGPVMANGQGRKSQDRNNSMYGTQYRRSSGVENTTSPGSSGSDQTYVQRPAAVSTGSQIGRYSHLGRTARRTSEMETRTDSPAMATNDELYAPLHAGGDAPLGSMVGPEAEARSRFARTYSSGV